MGPWASRCARTSASGLLAGLLLALPAALVVAPAVSAAAPAGQARTSAPVTRSAGSATTPLRIELDDITPAVLPRRGSITISGEVTNADAEAWTQINIYSFLDDDPIDDTAELAENTAAGEGEPVGDRITVDGTEDRIESLEPGESASFSLSVPSELVLARLGEAQGLVPEPGVYWFGVHALGTSVLGRDDFADARARTFIPLLPSQIPAPVPTAVVVPLRSPVTYASDGSLSDVTGWSRRLALGGRLRDRVDFGAASGSDPVSWLVDPGLLDAVARLAAGNPARSLAPNETPDGSGDGDGGAPDGGENTPTDGQPVPSPSRVPDASDDASDAPGRTTPDNAMDPETQEAAERALAWLNRITSEVDGDELLTLPFGDIDVSGAIEHDPALYAAARRRSSPTLRELAASPGTRSTPVVAPPNGLVDPSSLAALEDDPMVLATDEILEGAAPASLEVDGREVVLASSGARSGGPGPTATLGTLALRQRIISEAALRLIDRGVDDLGSPKPLVVVMPVGWRAESGSTFFDGLRSSPGLRLSRLSTAVAATSLPQLAADELVYPERQQQRELGELAFDAADSLRQSGATLQNVLSRNSVVGTAISGEAFTGVAYTSRRDRRAARSSMRASQRWIDARLSGVTIEAPPGVTLSGADGSFSATLVNTLDEPVLVQVEGISDSGVTIPVSAPVELGAQGRSTVLIEVVDVSPGVHNVSLRLVDTSGQALPSVDVVPIRSAQVSNVIWLIMGTGVALLFGAIGLRTVRRIRAARAARVARQARGAA